MLRYLVFLPSITLHLVPSEIFPWAVLYSLRSQIRSMSIGFIWSVIVFLSLLFMSLLNDASLMAALVSAASIANAYLISITVSDASANEINRLVRTAFRIQILLLVVGALQLIGVWALLDPITGMLIPRGGSEYLGAGGRGVSLLDTEPSRAGVNQLLIYTVWRAVQVTQGNRRYLWLSDLAMLVTIIVLTRSAVACFVALFYLGLTNFKPLRLCVSIIVVGVCFYVMALLVTPDDIRIYWLMEQLSVMTSWGEVAQFLISQSGFRGVSVIGAYSWSLDNMLGGGFGTWENTSVLAMEATGISASDLNYFRNWANGEYVPLKPTAFMAFIALEFGLFGVLLSSIWLFSRLKKMDGFSASALPTTLTIGFVLFLVGSVGNPVPWVCLALTSKIYSGRMLCRNEKMADLKEKTS